MSSTIKDNHMRAPQVEYALISSLAPRYKWLKVPLNNFTVPEIKIGATTNTMLEWKLPTQVYNLSRSVIEYAERVPAQPKQTVVWEDAFTLASSISFGAAGGMDLVNLQGAQKYSKIMRKINTDLDEMLTNDQTSGLYSSNVLASQNIVPYTLDSESSPAGLHRGVVNYLENRYVNTLVNWAADPPVGAIGGIDRYRRIPLGIYKGTLLGDDRDFYGGTQEMYLRVNAGPGDMMAFHATKALEPSVAGFLLQVGVISPSTMFVSGSVLKIIPRLSEFSMRSIEPILSNIEFLTPLYLRLLQVEWGNRRIFRFNCRSNMVRL